MTTRRDLLIQTAAAAAFCGGGASAQGAGATAGAALQRVFDAQTARLLAAAPETATQLGLDGDASAALKHRLDDTSPDAHARAAAASEAMRRDLDAVPEAGLSPADRVHRAVVLYAYRLGAEAEPFDFGRNTLFSAMGESAGPYVVNQSGGTYSGLPEFLDTQHKVATRDDAQAFLDRLDAAAPAIDGETERARADAGRGVVPPAYVLSNALGQMDGQLRLPPAQSRFVSTLRRKCAEAGLSGDWTSHAEKLVAERYLPALTRQRDTLRNLSERADDRAGVWRFRDGEAYYAWLLKAGANSSMTAAEAHQLGLEQNREIGSRMDALLKAQGLTQGTVGERMTALGKDPANLFPDTDAGRTQAVAYLQGRIDAMRAQMSRVSALGLKAPVQARRVPEQIQDGAGLGYMNPAPLDGSRPAIYYINLKTTTNWPRFTIPSLTYHETIPGHAWQFAYLTERKAVPTIRQILSGFNAYVEGWALYSEQLADEIGMYADDPLGRLGYLQAQKFRALRLVVDTGLHAQRWTRDQAVAFAVTESGRAEAAMRSEVDRYISTPGQACGYKVGHTEILKLRERSRAALGSHFDLVAFNDAVIRVGPAPLNVLEGELARWAMSALT